VVPELWSQLVADYHVRMWWEADSTQTEPDTVQVAAWYIVQSNWQDTLVVHRQSAGDTRFVVASVSEEDAPSPPPDVEAYKDKTTGATEARRGLSLHYERLAGGKDTGDVCLVYKRLPSIDRYSGYRRLQMYVHGDSSSADGGKYNCSSDWGVMRTIFTSTTRMSILLGSAQLHRHGFQRRDGLKNAAQQALPQGSSSVKIDTTEGNYRVVGDPNINEVRFFSVGVVNKLDDKERTGTLAG